MAEAYQAEDDAVLYVLGELTTARRREFEAQMAQSAELRQLVQELQEGALALSLTVPRRRPAPEIWTRIEKQLARGRSSEAGFAFAWRCWWRSGWAVATVCLLGWLIYALATGGSFRPATPKSPVLATENPAHSGPLANNPAPLTPDATPHSSAAVSNAALQLLQSRTAELLALRRQVTDLTNQMQELAALLMHQQGLLTEPDRIKFFQLTQTTNGSGTPESITSTNLQRALFLAMARELGWLPPGATNGADGGHPLTGSNANLVPVTQAGVDFVDLHPGSNTVIGPVNPGSAQAQVQTQPTGTGEDSVSLANLYTNAIPGGISSSNLFVAVDSSVVPMGTSVAFWMVTAGGSYLPMGTAVLGSNPMVVTVPTSAWGSIGGGYFTVTATGGGGTTTTLGWVALPQMLAPVSSP
ncbi:MAG TPA: hypothetical protein VL527_02415 [Dongiaceae bacterium]|nr:hypothetical protein [Dongiaceae bacterium]